MAVRLAIEKDFTQILDIINYAKKCLKNDGIDQWQDGYPNLQTIKTDFEKQQLYVHVKNNENSEDNNIVNAFCAIELEKSNMYENDLQGTWGYSGKYASVHRLAVSEKSKGKGYAKELLNYAIRIAQKNNCKSLRIDTHNKNEKMKHLIIKTGFTYRGILRYNDTSFRNAYDIKID